MMCLKHKYKYIFILQRDNSITIWVLMRESSYIIEIKIEYQNILTFNTIPVLENTGTVHHTFRTQFKKNIEFIYSL